VTKSESYPGIIVSFIALLMIFSGQVPAQTGNPNILVIWGDDIGWSNLSSYNHAVMATAPRISTALPMKAYCLPTTMRNRPARRVGQRLSPASTPSAPA